MMGIRGIIFYLRLAIKRPRNVWQVLCAFPKLLIQCALFHKTVFLVSRYSGIGDIVCTFPSLATIKKHNPKSFIVYETRRAYMPLVRRFRQVDLVVEEGSLLARLVPRLFKPKIAIYPLLPDERKPPQPRERIHLVEEFHKSFGLVSLNEGSARLDVTAKAVRQVSQRLKNEQICERQIVVIHTGPTWKVKEWPEEKWGELAGKLKVGNLIEIIQVGEDRTSYEEKCETPRVTGARDWVGTLSMDQTLALLSLADLFLGVDSGLLHLAGAVGAPCVGVFGPTDPACFLPKNVRAVGVTANVSCLGCHHDPQGPRHWQSGCSNNIQCMAELSVEDVFATCEKLLRLPQPIS